MRLVNGWWELYTIHESRMNFAIRVTVNTTLATTDTSSGTVSEIILSPSRPRGVTQDKRVSAHLVGELATYQQFPVLTSSKFLLKKGTYNFTAKDFMVIPDTMVTVDGSECNKVGVGFTAFKCDAQPPSPSVIHQASKDSYIVTLTSGILAFYVSLTKSVC
jgi:hypothetical protein